MTLWHLVGDLCHYQMILSMYHPNHPCDLCLSLCNMWYLVCKCFLSPPLTRWVWVYDLLEFVPIIKVVPCIETFVLPSSDAKYNTDSMTLAWEHLIAYFDIALTRVSSVSKCGRGNYSFNVWLKLTHVHLSFKIFLGILMSHKMIN